MHKMDSLPNILCLICKKLFNFKCKLVSCFNKASDTATKLGSKKNLFEDLETLTCNLTKFLKVVLRQYLNVFGLPAKLIALLLPGVNTSPYSHKFNSPICTKSLVEWISS